MGGGFIRGVRSGPGTGAALPGFGGVALPSWPLGFDGGVGFAFLVPALPPGAFALGEGLYGSVP